MTKRRTVFLRWFCLMVAVMTVALLIPLSSASAAGETVTCTAGSLSVRKGPGTKYARLGVLSRNQQVVVTGERNGWYSFEFRGQTGWASGKYLRFGGATPTPSVSDTVLGGGTICVTSAVVRSGPGSSYKKIGTVVKDRPYGVFEQRNGYSRIWYGTKYGWIASSAIALSGELTTPAAPSQPSIPSPPADPVTPDTAIGGGTICVTSAVVRSGPGSSYSKIGSVVKDRPYGVFEQKNGYSRIWYGTRYGWIVSSAIRLTAAETPPAPPPSTPPAQAGIVAPSATYSYGQLLNDIAALKQRYPDDVSSASLGQSLEGRDIPVVLVGPEEAQYHVLIHAGIHAREYLNCNLVMRQLEEMLSRRNEGYNGRTIGEWMQNVRFHIIPMINPDGVIISQTRTGSAQAVAVANSRRISASARANYYKLWKSNARGVDLNLQFPTGWDVTPGDYAAPANYGYKGPSPLSEPETIALAAYTRSRRFDCTVSYHSTGGVIYSNYKHASAADNAAAISLATAVKRLTGYSMITSTSVVAAGYKDWALTELSIPSITIETGTSSCPLPQSAYAGIWAKNQYLWMVLCEWVKSR